MSEYHNRPDASPTAAGDIMLLFGVHVQKDQHASSHESQRVLIQQLQVSSTLAVIAERMPGSRSRTVSQDR